MPRNLGPQSNTSGWAPASAGSLPSIYRPANPWFTAAGGLYTVPNTGTYDFLVLPAPVGGGDSSIQIPSQETAATWEVHLMVTMLWNQSVGTLRERIAIRPWIGGTPAGDRIVSHAVKDIHEWNSLTLTTLIDVPAGQSLGLVPLVGGWPSNSFNVQRSRGESEFFARRVA